MYGENKWNEMENKESVVDGTAEVVEEMIDTAKDETAATEQSSTGTPVDQSTGTYRWSKYRDGQDDSQQADDQPMTSQNQQASGQPMNSQNQQASGQPVSGQSQGTYGQPTSGQSRGTYGQPVSGQQSQQPYGQYNYGRSQQAGGQPGNQPGQNRGTYGQGYQNGQNYQNGQGYQNRQPYNNQYGYYQNRQQPQNGGAGGNYNTPKKKGSFIKKAAAVTAAALLFGVVSGATMFGVNRAAELLFPAETQTQAQAETQTALGVTETVPVTQETQAAAATGVVIEDVSPIVEAAMPSVVAINNTTLYQSSTWFGQTQTYEVPSSGSGIIVGENETELLIVTNNHVIEDATSMSVTFIDESTAEAALKGTDSESDLAVIAVPLDSISADTKAQIKAATIGDSDSLKMGQGVIAIGNALGHGQSVTVGHVSALDREITVDGVTKKVIQTDAAINPGNSGGALLNSKGELIGINEAKYADESVEGIGYAIPITYAMDIIEDLKLRTTKVEVAESEQGYLGIQVQNVDSSTAKMLGMPEGVYVYKITEGSAAAESGLREKDIITKFDGEKVRTNADLSNLLTYYKAGTTVTITVQSLENGEYVEREVEITLKNRPVEEETQVQPQGNRGQRP